MKNNKGFTLIEMVITITLIAVIVVISSDFILNLISSSIKIQNADTLEQNYSFISNKLVKMIQEADSVTIVNPTKIQINLYGTLYEVEVKSGGIYLNSALVTDPNTISIGAAQGNSNNDIFSYISSSNPQQVKIKLLFSIDANLGSKYAVSQGLERIATVRKSYK